MRESAGDLTRRGIAFLQWLMRRPEQRIAVVTHSSFLLHMLSACGGQAAPKVQVGHGHARLVPVAVAEGSQGGWGEALPAAGSRFVQTTHTDSLT